MKGFGHNTLPASRKSGLISPISRLLTLLSLLIITTVSTAAQDAAGTGELFAPFVSRIQAQLNEGKITITWKDSSDIEDGRYLVYRHTEAISEENFSGATFLSSVDSGTESYTDIPTNAGSYYYAVIIQEKDQTVYDIFIPYRNKIMNPLVVEGEPSEELMAAQISGINTVAEGNTVLVSYAASRPDRDLMLHRSTTPFNDASSLSPQTAVSTVKSSDTTIRDYPVPGIPYYYALVDKKLYQEGAHTISRGSNSTLSAVKIAISEQMRLLPERTTARSLPLPSLLMTRKITTGDPLAVPYQPPPEPMPLESATRESVSAFVSRFDTPRAPSARPEILAEDRNPAEDPAAITISQILEGPFAARKWPDAETQLRNFLAADPSDDSASRARFYLAQSLYFQGKMRNAFMEALMAEKHHPLESRRWQNYILDSLKKQS